MGVYTIVIQSKLLPFLVNYYHVCPNPVPFCGHHLAVVRTLLYSQVLVSLESKFADEFNQNVGVYHPPMSIVQKKFHFCYEPLGYGP